MEGSKYRIVFLTTCLEPGRSGVGDVTRHLAEELAGRGHRCLVLALCDEYWTSATPTTLSTPTPGLSLQRYSSTVSWSGQAAQIRGAIETFQPDLISLQLVCYAFDRRGLTWKANPWLAKIAQGYPVQVMFHELWVGQNTDASIREVILGWLQKQSLLALLRRLRPTQIHTSNPTYRALLERAGVRAGCLALPTAVPIAPDADRSWFFERCREAGLPIDPKSRSSFRIFGFFGTLHPVWPPEPFLSRVRAAMERGGWKAVFCAIGALGAGQPLWDRLAVAERAWSRWICFGKQSEERVSHFFQEVDYGVATTPWEIIGKSSSATTMLEHGVPVLVNRQIQFRVGTDGLPADDPQLILMDAELSTVLVEGRSRRPAQERSPAVADQFLRDCFPSSVPA